MVIRNTYKYQSGWTKDVYYLRWLYSICCVRFRV